MTAPMLLDGADAWGAFPAYVEQGLVPELSPDFTNILPVEAEKNNMPCWTNRPWPHNLNQTASGNPRTVQCGLS